MPLSYLLLHVIDDELELTGMAKAALLSDFLKIELISYITGRMPEGLGVGDLNEQEPTEKRKEGKSRKLLGTGSVCVSMRSKLGLVLWN